MSVTVTTPADVNAEIERLEKSMRKASKARRANYEQKIQALRATLKPTAKRGRPKGSKNAPKFAPEFYQTVESLSRGTRGRPSLTTLLVDAKRFGLDVPKDATWAQVAPMVRDARKAAIEAAKVPATA